jgi:PelA/Pel-15E family pectate lyase
MFPKKHPLKPRIVPVRFRHFVVSLLFSAGIAIHPLSASHPIPLADLRGFDDGIHHWRNKHNRIEYERYPPEQIAAIADNILLWQRSNGGWKENEDPCRVLNAEQRRQILADKDLVDTSFDNRNVWPQVHYLASAYTLLGDERYLQGCMQGIEFILKGQHSSGGWPHSFPSEGDYRQHLTFTDDVIPDQLGLLREIAAGNEPFKGIPQGLRERALAAVQRGDRFILDRQVLQNGIPTVWAGQYDRNSLQPVGARSFELPGLLGRESVAVVRYLMSIPEPSKEVISAIRNAVAWFQHSAIQGWRFERFEIESERYQFHTAQYDRSLVEDPYAPALWARFYDLETNEPFLANRDGIKVYKLEEVSRERRTGYDWYGTWPQTMLEHEFPRWKQSLGSE